MREAALWVSGAFLAFLATAGAFLLLANLGTGPSETNLTPDPPPEESGPALELTLNRDRLASLRALPGQELAVGVRNAGGEDLSDIHLTLEVSSENTALSEARYYRKTIEELPAGRRVDVPFYLDLSAAVSTASSSATASAVPEPPRKIIEVRATTPGGVSTIKTAIVPV
ncbi:MAG TPA: hypothetical protein VHH10_02605 [Rubrobacteraceae bacterium]|nr:hypothetical protein [Rubrobacteraceae bacterium]